MRTPSFFLLFCLAAGCTNEASTEPGDSPGDAGAPSPLGNGLHIAQMNQPDSAVVNDQMGVGVTGATFIIKDTYNENGKPGSVGAVYVQDFHSDDGDAGGAAPYSGIELYKSTYQPASLALAPGDIVDFTGEYQVYDGQPEMYEPIVTFRFDYAPPKPRVINVQDLESLATGYRWMSMLVTVVGGLGGDYTESGAGSGGVFLTKDTGQNGVTMNNALYPLPYSSAQFAPNANGHLKIKSVTGVVTYYYSFSISPRSADDVQTELIE